MVVVGNIMLDIVLHYSKEYVKGGNVLYEGTTCFGGGGANVAFYLAAMGARTCLVGALGADAIGRVYLEHLKQARVEFRGQVVDGVGTGVVVALVHPDGDRSFLVNPGANNYLSPRHVVSVVESERPRVVFVHGYNLEAPGQAETVVETLKAAKRVRAITVFDPAAHNLVRVMRRFLVEEVLPLVDVVLPNEDEALALSSRGSLEESVDILKALSERVVVKLGRKGALVVDGEKRVVVDALEPREFRSSVGAGDAFDAAVVYGLLVGADAVDAARAGARLAAEVLACDCAQCWSAYRVAEALGAELRTRSP